ncbi:MAG TPA: glycosyltransferase family 1 protein [Acetobacteraceae bacterium]
MTARIWIDVEDIFAFAATGRTPTGIQRLAFELCRALHEIHGHNGEIRLVRQSRDRRTFVEVPWQSLDELFDQLASRSVPQPEPGLPDPSQSAAPSVPEGKSGWRGMVRTGLRPVLPLIPQRLRMPLIHYVRLQARAIFAFIHLCWAIIRAAGALVRFLWRGGKRSPAVVAAEPVIFEPGSPLEAKSESEIEPLWEAQPGDVLFIMGAAWFHPDYAAVLDAARQAHGVRVAALIYDIIPLRRPEWCDRQHAEVFQGWFESVLPRCDRIFAISRASADEVTDYARLHNLCLRDVIHPIPIGTGFAQSRTLDKIPAPADATAFAGLPEPGSYVLFVSTIEARKNHALLFRVWRNLLEQMPPERVPVLVFAGRIGWLVQDLMQQLRNTAFLNGKIMLVEHPTDAELVALYRGCRFTLFPSFYEGWGLPVTESLAFGKPCIISNRTSLPEAGGSLARYFDPEDVADAERVIRETIEDPEGLAQWEARVVREFRPVPWEDSARAVMRHLQVDRTLA